MARRAEVCPWCGAPHRELTFRDVAPGRWVVACGRCNASGPLPDTEPQSYEEAIARWNGEEPPLCNR